MSTSTIGQYFSNRVEELISEFTGHTLIFFKGFGLEQIRFLITHPNSLLDDASLLHEGFLDLEAIDDRWLDLAASIKSATKPLVGFYEELLAIRQFLPRMKVETVVLLSKGEIDSKKVRVEFSLEDMDMSGFQKGATYEQIKTYVLEHSGLKVSSLYISQVKRKCGLDVGQNYNLSKKEDAKVPQCPPEKERAIRDALKFFHLI